MIIINELKYEIIIITIINKIKAFYKINEIKFKIIKLSQHTAKTVPAGNTNILPKVFKFNLFPTNLRTGNTCATSLLYSL